MAVPLAVPLTPSLPMLRTMPRVMRDSKGPGQIVLQSTRRDASRPARCSEKRRTAALLVL
ncbi:hypothetical protein DIPPA_28854 [Diplonema papillatum]|nr:hypothetical protein DIPPA_28854 [Diplonema papillatum]